MDADTDAVFAGDANIEGKPLNKSGASRSSGYEGEENATLARGGIDTGMAGHATEDDPLLPNSNAQSNDDGATGQGWSRSTDFDGSPWYKRPSIFFMLGPFLIMTLAFGGIITPRIKLVLNLICREYFSEKESLSPDFTMLPILFNGDNPQCRNPEVQSRVAQFSLYGNLIAGLLSAVTSPKLGALSDRYGRTKLLALTSMGTIMGEVIMIIAATYPDKFPVNWILVGFAMDGICGSFVCAMAISNAYASDCTPPAQRNIAFGYLHGCLFTGIALGPIAAGFVVKATGSVLSIFYISLAVHTAFVAFVFFVVPESLSKARQRIARQKHHEEKLSTQSSSDWIDQLRAINLLEPLKILWPRGEGTSPALRRNLAFLAAVDTLIFGIGMGSMTIVLLYVYYQFGWDTFQSSEFLSIVNTCRVLSLVVVLPLLTKFVRGRGSATQQRSSGSDNFDLTLIRVAILFDIVGGLGYALARNGSTVTIIASIASVGGIGSPTLQSALTKHVPADQTGRLLGATGLLHALARVVAPTILNGIYSATVGKFTQTVFVVLTAAFAIAFVLSLFVKPHVYYDDHYDRPQHPTYSDNVEADAVEEDLAH